MISQSMHCNISGNGLIAGVWVEKINKEWKCTQSALVYFSRNPEENSMNRNKKWVVRKG